MSRGAVEADAAAVARVLGLAGLWPHELTTERQSLERVFLELTAGGDLNSTQGRWADAGQPAARGSSRASSTAAAPPTASCWILALGLLAPAQWMPSTGPLDRRTTRGRREGYQSCLEWEEFDACVYDQFLRVPMDFLEVVSSLASSVLFLGFVVFLVVVTYVGSDFSSGALGTQLTFTPRRWAVLVSRSPRPACSARC